MRPPDELFPRFVVIHSALCVPLYVALEIHHYDTERALPATQLATEWYVCHVPHNTAFKLLTKKKSFTVLGATFHKEFNQQVGVKPTGEAQLITVCQFDSKKMKNFIFPEPMTTPVENEKELQSVWFPIQKQNKVTKPILDLSKDPGPQKLPNSEGGSGSTRLALNIIVEYYSVTGMANGLNPYYPDTPTMLGPQGAGATTALTPLHRAESRTFTPVPSREEIAKYIDNQDFTTVVRNPKRDKPSDSNLDSKPEAPQTPRTVMKRQAGKGLTQVILLRPKVETNIGMINVLKATRKRVTRLFRIYWDMYSTSE